MLVEGESDAKILITAWEKLSPNTTRPFDLRTALGAKNVNITLNDQDIISKLGSRKIVGLFDYDKAYDQWKGTWKAKWRGSDALLSTSLDDAEGLLKKHASGQAWSMLLPVPAFRTDYANQTLKGDSILSIEFLFPDTDIPPGMIAHRPIAMGQQLRYIPDSSKAAFAEYVATLPVASFNAFRPLFNRFEGILNSSL